MQKKTGILVGTVAAALLLQAGVAMAENRGSTFTLSPYAGGYTYQGSQKIKTGPVVGGRLGYNLTDNWGLEGIVDYAEADNKNVSGKARKTRYGADVLYNFLPETSFVPYLAAGVGGMNLRDRGDTFNRAVYNYGGGIKWFVMDDIALRADVRGLNYSIDKIKTNVQYTLGVHFVMGPAKEAPAPVVVAPPPPPPPPAPTPSANLSAAPGTVEAGQSVTLSWNSENTTGCDIQPGIGPVAPKGSQTVAPAADTSYTLVCQGEGGKANSSAAVTVTPVVIQEAAAPKASPVVAGNRYALKVKFDFDKEVIKNQYFEELNEIGEGMQADTTLKGTIEGHTDSTGKAAYNKALSERRAKAVRDYIIKNYNIEDSRINVIGYGAEKPIADNKTAAGRAQNRRIEAVFE
ncbi:MAG: OmpA family protein [Trichlorobacter sp.]|nr:OmpA family protein [Trichlorobacter sp.]